jgi:Zn-dependent oligopeptidase
VGYCYLDLFPRGASAFFYQHLSAELRSRLEYKYGHAAVWPLLPGYLRSDGERAYPLAAMVADLAKPTPDRPALMCHNDVVTFFHEMGGPRFPRLVEPYTVFPLSWAELRA